MIVISLEKARAIAHQLANQIVDNVERSAIQSAIEQASIVEQLQAIAAQIRQSQ